MYKGPPKCILPTGHHIPKSTLASLIGKSVFKYLLHDYLQQNVPRLEIKCISCILNFNITIKSIKLKTL